MSVPYKMTVSPRTLRRPSDELRCDVRKVYGYQAECGCGWKGNVWRTVSGSRLEASFHECLREAA